MRIKWIMLANAAELAEGRKLSMLGADFDTIIARQFPAVHHQMYVVVKLIPEEQDFGRPQNLVATIVDPDGGELARTPALGIECPPTPAAGERPQSIAIVANLMGLPLPRPGRYSIHLTVDGVGIGDTAFEAQLAQPEGSQ